MYYYFFMVVIRSDSGYIWKYILGHASIYRYGLIITMVSNGDIQYDNMRIFVLHFKWVAGAPNLINLSLLYALLIFQFKFLPDLIQDDKLKMYFKNNLHFGMTKKLLLNDNICLFINLIMFLCRFYVFWLKIIICTNHGVNFRAIRTFIKWQVTVKYALRDILIFDVEGLIWMSNLWVHYEYSWITYFVTSNNASFGSCISFG